MGLKIEEIEVGDETLESPNLKYMRRETRGIIQALDAPSSLVQLTEQIFTQACNAGVEGYSISRFTAASFFAACKMQNIPVSDFEIADVSHCRLGEITEAYHRIADGLGLAIEPTDPVPFIERFHGRCDLSDEALEWALAQDTIVRDAVLGRGVAPSSYAAAILYCASRSLGEKVTQAEIGEVADVSPVTIRNRYQEIFAAVEGQKSI